jgi:hypothetical protein
MWRCLAQVQPGGARAVFEGAIKDRMIPSRGHGLSTPEFRPASNGPPVGL